MRFFAEAGGPETLIDKLRLAVAPDSTADPFDISVKLAARYGDEAVPAIERALPNSNGRMAEMLVSTLASIRSNKSTTLLLRLLDMPQFRAPARSALVNRDIRVPVSPSQRAALTNSLAHGGPSEAGQAARVLGACRAVPPADRVGPIVDRFIIQVLAPWPEREPITQAYMPYRYADLHEYLLAISFIGSPAVPRLRLERVRAGANKDLDTWLLFALGMAGEETVAGELAALIQGSADNYLRAEGVRAYARAAKEAAIPLLESLVAAGAQGVSGSSIPQRGEYALRIATRDSLVRIRQHLLFTPGGVPTPDDQPAVSHSP